MQKLTLNIPDILFDKLRKMKEEDKYGDKPWEEWLRYITRGINPLDSISSLIQKSTQENLAKLWSENFILNLSAIIDYGKYPEDKEWSSIGSLPKLEGKNGLVIGAGPSIYKHNHIQQLSEHSSNKTALFLTDRMTIPCLKGGVTPDKYPSYYIVSVDGNRELIVKWFEDPILDEWAPKITGLFCTTMAPNAVQRFKKAGGITKFWHGMMDNFQIVGSATSLMNLMTGSTAIAAGGNCGASAFTLAYYFGCRNIGLVGLDLGYLPETPIEETAYYKQLKASGAPLEVLEKTQFTKGFNPLFGTEFKTDIVFHHYAQAFFEMVEVTRDVEVINCTEGGAVYGSRIVGMRLKDFIRKYG